MNPEINGVYLVKSLYLLTDQNPSLSVTTDGVSPPVTVAVSPPNPGVVSLPAIGGAVAAAAVLIIIIIVLAVCICIRKRPKRVTGN